MTKCISELCPNCRRAAIPGRVTCGATSCLTALGRVELAQRRANLDQVTQALLRAALVAGSKWVRRAEGNEPSTVFTVRAVTAEEVTYTFVEERLCYLDVDAFLDTFAHYTGEVC